MVHGNGREVPGIRQTPRQSRAGQKCADQPGTGSVRDTVQVLGAGSSLFEDVPDEREEFADMVSGSQLGHHPAIQPVELDLTEQLVGQKALLRVKNGGGALVTGGLQSENARVFCLCPRAHLESPALLTIPTVTEVSMPSVRVRENEYFDAALRRFKRACEKAGILTELRRREFYEKPTQERKRKKAAAIKRHMKRISRDGMRATR